MITNNNLGQQGLAQGCPSQLGQLGQLAVGAYAWRCQLPGYANTPFGQLGQHTVLNNPSINGAMKTFRGNSYLVVCNGEVTELSPDASLEAAQERAEQQAHQHQTEAYILKPVRKVAPKRDVVTTDL